MERAKSEGATPTGSPRKWTTEERVQVKESSGGVVMGVVREMEALSTDEEGGEEVKVRPRQRSLRRNKKKIGFTNTLTSQQLVSEVGGVVGRAFTCGGLAV